MNLTARTVFASTGRRIAVAAALAGVAFGGPAIALAATAAPARPAASPAVPPACETPGLVIWLTSQGAGAGSAFYTLNFTNLSGHTCTLNGYPFVHAATLKNNNVGRRAKFQKPKPALTTIKNGQTATASLRVVDAFNFPKATCAPKTEAGFKVFPPNQLSGKIVPLPVDACTKAGVNFMFVGRVH